MVLTDTDLVVDAAGRISALAGGRAIAEMTVMGWGRDVAVLARSRRATGIHVIATSGFYVEDCLPDFARTASVEELTEFLVQEITEGADGTGIRTGILKSGVGRPVIEGVELRCAQAVARAQRRHRRRHHHAHLRLQPLRDPRRQPRAPASRRLRSRGRRSVPRHHRPHRRERRYPAIAGAGAARRLRAVRRHRQDALAARRTRVELLAKLADAGYVDRLLLSTDRCRVTELKAKGGPGYDHLLRNFVPKLRQAGFDDAMMHQILVANPARILSFDRA